MSHYQEVETLEELNNQLTESMADKSIQTIIRGDALLAIVERVIEFKSEGANPLLAASSIGRLAAVSRNRQDEVYEAVTELFSEAPQSVDTLGDSDAKQYAAQVITRNHSDWVRDYSIKESVNIDTADKARVEFMLALLKQSNSVEDWIRSITESKRELRKIIKSNSRLRRVKRIFTCMHQVIERWRGDVGNGIGICLSECYVGFMSEFDEEADADVLYETTEIFLELLIRVVEMRFSFALNAETYQVLNRGKQVLGAGQWARFLDQSLIIAEIRTVLLEASLVLARQNITDSDIMNVLSATYSSKPRIKTAIKSHFRNARDLDPDIDEWWKSAGTIRRSTKQKEQKIGNNEDAKIGNLLIEVEDNHERMSKVDSAIRPILEINQPVHADTLKKALTQYKQMEKIIRSLARARKLTRTHLQGHCLDYNPRQHEMEGGHQHGERQVRVIRDGVQKDFAGSLRTIVKPTVKTVE